MGESEQLQKINEPQPKITGTKQNQENTFLTQGTKTNHTILKILKYLDLDKISIY